MGSCVLDLTLDKAIFRQLHYRDAALHMLSSFPVYDSRHQISVQKKLIMSRSLDMLVKDQGGSVPNKESSIL